MFISAKEDRKHIMKKASIILADKNVTFRKALRRIIQKDPTLSVINEVGDGVELLKLLEETRPDAVILDISMPKLSGLHTALIIKQFYPEVKVVILTLHREKEYFLKANAIGVEGYVIKHEADNINLAIKNVLNGKKYLCSPPTNGLG